jgi:molybdopterin-guanine dinucleotide biosynthesis protein B
MRIISVVGQKDSGKTSLTIRIIKELRSRNFKVASIKHSHHKMIMDKEGTDTYKHKEAGSEIVVGIGSSTFFNIDKQLSLDRILFLIKTIEEPDFVVIEGFKGYNYPKIATSPDVIDEYTIDFVNAKDFDDEKLVLLVDKIEKYGYDILDTLFVDDCGYNDAKVIAKAFINDDLQYVPESQADVSLSVNGINIGINSFVNDFMKNTILGILKSLKTKEYGVENFDKIEILINNKKD